MPEGQRPHVFCFELLCNMWTQSDSKLIVFFQRYISLSGLMKCCLIYLQISCNIVVIGWAYNVFIVVLYTS